MQDILYVAGTIGFFALMALFVAGCERIIGNDDSAAVPGGLTDEPTAHSAELEVTR